MATRTKHYALPTERTAIRIVPLTDITMRCHKCKRDVFPNQVSTKFLSTPLYQCPTCKSVLQDSLCRK